MSERGPIRKLVDSLRLWCELSKGKLTMEDVADIFDGVNANKVDAPSPTDVPSTLANMTPAKGKH